MKTYVINLKQAESRRIRIKKLLSSYEGLDLNFIEAVDGRIMNEEEIDLLFDRKTAFKYYGRNLMKGEIGCTLSHIACFNHMLEQNEKSVLILEDDVEFIKHVDFEMLNRYLTTTEKPIIILLSGHFWHWPSIGNMKRVYSAYYTHAYAINLPAARLLVKKLKYPWHLADNWIYINKLGIKVYGMRPHLINQLSSNMGSTVLDFGLLEQARSIKKKYISKPRLIEYYKEQLIQRGLKYIGCFEKD